MAMNVLEKFNIDIYKLQNGVHLYQFDIDDQFFEAFENSIIDKGKGSVKLELEKTETFIRLHFDISTSVQLECDRSLDLFDYPIHSENSLILKFGDHEEEINEEISIIPRDRQRINLAQYIYEFIGLSIPMKKLHPRYKDENEDDELIYSSDKSSEDQDNEGKSDEDIDPRWQKLKNLNKN
ncbi:ribosomal protein L32p [Fulvivirga imtechensis AK7]|uniref:Ribosomal protein L32p n=2 Tax=Fulvivirga TaxID=396811 RepID=L8JL58_9BACT|nr:ribosomal protein L32p [Fulvivirga imtechensis AK7]